MFRMYRRASGRSAFLTPVILASLSAALLLCAAVLLLLASRFGHDVTEPQQLNHLSVSSENSAAPSVTGAKREERGIWIASVFNINFPSKSGLSAEQLRAELDDIVETADSVGLNSIYFQVRPSSDALYDSKIFPVSKYLGDTLPEGFDPLAYIIERAHERGIALHAWINPLRASADTNDLSKLPEHSPARKNPSYSVAYKSQRYYDCGIPEVRQLVADGIAEIINNYDIDGIIFDDYFYPYPENGVSFDDGATFQKYGGAYSDIGDFRRDSVNKLVKLCYDTVKALDPECRFGIAPFGIWKNDDGKNGGSATNGLSSYSAIYCDTLAWIKGGYVDYVAPQIYWQFSTSVARYDVLVRWWNAVLSEYPNVDLYISHAAYRASEWASGEIRNQIEYARSERAYAGSILYGYASVKADEAGLAADLKKAFSSDIVYTSIYSDGSPVSINTPQNGAYVDSTGTYLIGTCDPGFPLYFNGKPVSVTKSGLFSVYTAISEGENRFVFSQNGTETVHIINGGKKNTSGGWTGYATLPDFRIVSVSPSLKTIVNGGETLSLSVTAPHGAEVTATLGNYTIKLNPTINPVGKAENYKEIYAGELTLPEVSSLTSLGCIVFNASRNGRTASLQGAEISVLEKNGSFPVSVKNDDTLLKISPTSWYYDDFKPQASGMTDNAVRLENGFYKLRMGGYISASNAEIVSGDVPLADVSRMFMHYTYETTTLRFYTGVNVPVHTAVTGGKFIVTLFNCSSVNPDAYVFHRSNPLFSDFSVTCDQKTQTVTYSFEMYDAENYYGCRFLYKDEAVCVILTNPVGFERENMLTGKTIVLDAGHGGTDPGALGPVRGFSEKDINLAIVLEAQNRLELAGARVILTRSDDSYVSIDDRMARYNEICPDLAVSVHQNSMDFSADITKIRGLVSLWFADSGRMLAECVSSGISGKIGRLERPVAQQRLAMLRNPKFPASLVEVGFITCVEEVEVMRKHGVSDAAAGICDAVFNFFTRQQDYILYDRSGSRTLVADPVVYYFSQRNG